MENFSFAPRGRTLVCGILNITPDSFSDGGLYNSPEAALSRALEMQEQGADIIDVGAQSTRPGAQPLSADEERGRLLPVLGRLSAELSVPLSVDTFYPECARAALEHGARVINDVSGACSDEMAQTVADFGAGWIIMHNPAGADALPDYEGGVIKHVREFFLAALERAQSFGIEPSQLCFDPGIGFAKSCGNNLTVIKELKKLKIDGTALMSAASRKRFIGEVAGESEPARRDPGTVAAHVISIMNGADIIRVHDVAAAVQSARVADALLRAGEL